MYCVKITRRQYGTRDTCKLQCHGVDHILDEGCELVGEVEEGEEGEGRRSEEELRGANSKRGRVFNNSHSVQHRA